MPRRPPRQGKSLGGIARTTEALTAQGGQVKYTVLPEAGHIQAWVHADGEAGLFAWFAQQCRRSDQRGRLAMTLLAKSAGLPACQRHTITRSWSGDTTMVLLPAPSAA